MCKTKFASVKISGRPLACLVFTILALQLEQGVLLPPPPHSPRLATYMRNRVNKYVRYWSDAITVNLPRTHFHV